MAIQDEVTRTASAKKHPAHTKLIIKTNETLWARAETRAIKLQIDIDQLVERALFDHLSRLSPRGERDAARANTKKAHDERNLLLMALRPLYKMHLAETTNHMSPTDTWRFVVCVHFPTGNECWKITEEQAKSVFAALPVEADDWVRHTHSEKLANLERLVGFTKGNRR